MRPTYRVWADQRDITDAIRDRLLSLTLTDESGYQSDTVSLRLDDRESKIELPRKGAQLEVELGYEERGLAQMGLYIVDELELAGPPDTLTIQAKAVDMKSSLKQHKTRAWSNTIQEIVSTIAQEHGLEPRVDPALGAIRIPHIDQTEESDLNFLTRLGNQYDAVGKPAGPFVLFVPHGQAQSASGRATAASIYRPQTSDYRVTLADRGEFRTALAHWQDVEAGQQMTERVGDGEPAFTLRHAYPTAKEARAAAQAKLNALTRGLATISLTMKPGDPTLAAEAKLALSGFRKGVDGEWIATRVTHELTSSGYTTRVEAETPTSK